MVDDWSNIALRFALYLDLTVLLGVPLFATTALTAHEHGAGVGRRYARFALTASVLGALLSLVGLFAMAKQMAGASDYASVTSHVLQMILTRTSAGIAWAVRAAALAACIAAALMLRGHPTLRFAALACSAAVALATLAWSGHGAMHDGARGYAHLASDVVHLIAAGAWVGTLVAFVTLPAASEHTVDGGLETLHRTASGFAGTGTAIVVALTVTGAINYVMVVGPSVQGLLATVYGRLLTAKLALFAVMLALAAANRYRLTPRLEAALACGEKRQAARALRRSLRLESAMAFTVLAVVAWLGTLSPDA